MKKVKIMLSALVVVAAIGGALAFKAKNPTYCFYKKNTAGLCPLVRTIETYSTHINSAAVASVIDKPIGEDCPDSQLAQDCTLRVSTTTTNNN